ncbi:MAG: lipase family protein [Pseudomonadota bacterium]
MADYSGYKKLIDNGNLKAALNAPDKYSPELSLLAGVLSTIAYTGFDADKDAADPISEEGRAQLERELQSLGLDYLHCINVPSSDTKAFCATHEAGFGVVAYRGTESLKDWKVDVHYDHEETDLGDFHGGFLGSVEDAIKAEIMHDGLGDLPILLCGHSLGGALAKIHAIKYPPEKFFAVYTIGAPRIASEGVKIPDGHAGRYFRVVNQNDVIPHVPFTFVDFKHVGTLVRCADDGAEPPTPDHDYDDTVRNAVSEFREALGDNRQTFYAEVVKVFGTRPRQLIRSAWTLVTGFLKSKEDQEDDDDSVWLDMLKSQYRSNKQIARQNARTLFNNSILKFGLDHKSGRYLTQLVKPFQDPT